MFDSFDSTIALFGSAVQLPLVRGEVYTPFCDGVTRIETSNVPEPDDTVTGLPLAVQVSLLAELIEHAMLPQFVTALTPWTVGWP